MKNPIRHNYDFVPIRLHFFLYHRQCFIKTNHSLTSVSTNKTMTSQVGAAFKAQKSNTFSKSLLKLPKTIFLGSSETNRNARNVPQVWPWFPKTCFKWKLKVFQKTEESEIEKKGKVAQCLKNPKS